MVAVLANRVFRVALLAGVFVTPAFAQDHPAPIISYPISGNGDGVGSSAGLLAIMQTLHAMRAQLRSLENQAEITNHKIELLRKQQQAFLADIDRQLRRLRNKPGGETPSSGSTVTPSMPGPVEPGPGAPPPAAAPAPQANTPPGGTSAPASAPPVRPPGAANRADRHSNVTIVPPDTADTGRAAGPPPVASGAQTAYAQAFNALRAGQYNQAVAGFQHFLVRYPSDKRDAEAQYWIAETQYMERDYAAARLSFRTLVYAYPQSRRVPNALLKIGYMAKWRGRPGKARAIWERLMQKYPMSAAAQVARNALTKLSTATSSSVPGQP
ncbi:MAG: tol-pal system protein YbgF [Gammaproteobacteria bacterium]|nr:tol-pal system protein YbgF [Gammaproteobacteria bacterium]